MRLLVVSQYFWPENFRINDLVSELVSRGHHVTILTGKPNYPEGKLFDEFCANPKSYMKFAGANIIRVPMMVRGQGSFHLILNYLSYAINASVIGLWKLRGCKFDAIFTFQTSPVTVGLPAILMRTIKRAPMVFWILDLWPETLQAVGIIRNPRYLFFFEKLVSFIYKRCDLILAQSKSFIPNIKKYINNPSIVHYFPSWAESVYDIQQVEPAIEVSKKSNCFNVMFAGNIGDAQDFPSILAAAEILKSNEHIRWLIVGDGRAAQWVKEEIRRRGLTESVQMLGRYPLERMPSFFKHANALLVSLKDEPIFSMTIPGKLQSYLASGIPVVGMLNGEGAEVVKASQAGLICPAGDYKGLAVLVLKLSQMSLKDRESLGNNGMLMSCREFDRKTLIDRLESWFEEVKIRGVDRQNPSEHA